MRDSAVSLTSPLANPVPLFDLHPSPSDFRREALQGLLANPKHISPKFLYDERGAGIFESICHLAEYYPTRTEMEILQERVGSLARLVEGRVLVEFGSGAAQKVRLILNAVSRYPIYVAVDISRDQLVGACIQLGNEFPGLQTHAVCMDFLKLGEFPAIPGLEGVPRVGFFPGSSIGNLEPEDALRFLKNVRAFLGRQGQLVVGVDLKKSPQLLEAAYDDDQGISAAFARNLLVRMNRELGADFDLDGFDYEAVYNRRKGRVEMSLVSLREQRFRVAGVTVPFRAGERLLTEHSYKYEIDEFRALSRQAGFHPLQCWTDGRGLFSVHVLGA